MMMKTMINRLPRRRTSRLMLVALATISSIVAYGSASTTAVVAFQPAQGLVSHHSRRRAVVVLPTVPTVLFADMAPEKETLIRSRSSSYERGITANIVPTSDNNNTNNSKLTVSLLKSIVGGGVLALPAALSALGDTPAQVLPAAAVTIGAAGAVYAYYFVLLGRVCAWTGATTYRQAWERTVGGVGVRAEEEEEDRSSDNHSGSQVVAVVVALKTLLACVAFSMILADSFSSLAVAAGCGDVSRGAALGAVTGTVLLPLCLQKNLSSLAPFSLVGLLSFAVTVVTMVTRALDGSYHQPPLMLDGMTTTVVAGGGEVGRYLADLPDNLLPAFGSGVGEVASSLVPNLQGVMLLSTLATAFVAHYNAPRFFSELALQQQDKHGSTTLQQYRQQDHTQPLEHFHSVVSTAYAVATLVFMTVAGAGFVTFGTHAQPMVLNSYSPFDPLVAVCRATLAASILLTFPLPFVGLRDGVMELWQSHRRPCVGGEGTEEDATLVRTVTFVLLALATAIAISIQDLDLVLSVGGGTFSTAVASVFPTLMFCAAVENGKKQEEAGGASSANRGAVDVPSAMKTTSTLAQNELEAKLAVFLMCICVTVGLTGALNKVFHWL